MHPVILVALGGALGSLARFGLSSLIIKQINPVLFPWPTFTVNILGCIGAGLFLGLTEYLQAISHTISQETRLFIVTGLLGGFTTFSAFGIETLGLIRRGELFIALSYVSLSVIIGIAAMWLTFLLCRLSLP